MNDKKTREEWAELISDFTKSGLSRSEFCKRMDIKPSTFDYWKKQNRVNKNEHRFVKIEQLAMEPRQNHYSMRVSTGGYTVEFMRSVPVEEVRAVLSMCKELS
jgi:transposase-like protein